MFGERFCLVYRRPFWAAKSPKLPFDMWFLRNQRIKLQNSFFWSWKGDPNSWIEKCKFLPWQHNGNVWIVKGENFENHTKWAECLKLVEWGHWWR